MNVENINNKININEVAASQDRELRSKLARSIRLIADLRYKAEQNGLAAGSTVAEQVVLQNIPLVEYVVDGDLRTGNGPASSVEDRVNSLPLNLVTDTQERVDGLLSTMNAISSITTAKRLEVYLPFVLPRTREGFGALQFISRNYAAGGSFPNDEKLATGVSEITKMLNGLDRVVVTTARNDALLMSDLLEDAREVARLKLPELLEKDSNQIGKLRAIVAEQKLSRLRHEVARVDGSIEYSSYELLINEIIDREGLSEQFEEAKKKRANALEQPKSTILNNLARRRSIQRVMSQLEEDPFLCVALAKRERMIPEELLNADEAIKKRAVNNALNSKIIVLSLEERRVFNGSQVIEDEKRQLGEEMRDPLVFISRLSDEEIASIRNGIPRISDRRSVFYLARDRLREQIENEVTEEELLEVLTQQTIREFLSRRCTMAVDLAIRDLGIDPDQLLRGPSVLLQSKDIILEKALSYLRFDSPPLRLSNVEVEGYSANDSARVLEMDKLKCIAEVNMTDLLEKLAESPDLYGVRIDQREGVKIYMVDQKAREILIRVSKFLADLTKISDKVILPETENEMSCLLTMVVDAITTGKPLILITPICPDWSRDSEGRYDFKSLGGGESYIAKKFFTYGVELLAVFAKHQIPFKGVLQFADWGLETEINAKDTYGRKLSGEDIQMCFKSTVAATDEHLRSLQLDRELGNLFANYSIVSMKESLESKLDIPEVQSKLEKFLTSDMRGRRLLDTLAEQSFKVNQARLGLTREENRKFALQNLIEYATEGQSIGPHSILVVCESRTTSRVYNLPRQKNENIPLLFIKGKEGIDKGVNIL